MGARLWLAVLALATTAVGFSTPYYQDPYYYSSESTTGCGGVALVEAQIPQYFAYEAFHGVTSRCVWYLTANDSSHTVQFTSPSVAQFGNRFELRDGADETSPLIAIVTDRYQFSSTGQFMTVIFTAMGGPWDDGVGFVAMGAVPVSCPTTPYEVWTNQTTEYDWPGGSSSNSFGIPIIHNTVYTPSSYMFPQGLTCSWIVRAPPGRLALVLTILNSDAYYAPLSVGDTVTVYDGASVSAPVLGTVGVTNEFFRHIGTTGDVLVVFKTSQGQRTTPLGDGSRAPFQFIVHDVPSYFFCEDKVPRTIFTNDTSPTHYLTEPSQPVGRNIYFPYARPGVTCVWLFTTSPGWRFEFTLPVGQLFVPSALGDSLVLYDGPTNTANKLFYQDFAGSHPYNHLYNAYSTSSVARLELTISNASRYAEFPHYDSTLRSSSSESALDDCAFGYVAFQDTLTCQPGFVGRYNSSFNTGAFSVFDGSWDFDEGARYQGNRVCKWVFTVLPGEIANFHLNKLELSPNDNLTLLETATGRVINRWSGYNTQGLFGSTDDGTYFGPANVTVVFAAGGDYLKYPANRAYHGVSFAVNIYSDSLPTCAPTTMFSPGSQEAVEISGTYQPNMNCTWSMTSVVPGEVIQVRLYGYYRFALGDTLVIYDGPNAASPVLADLTNTPYRIGVTQYLYTTGPSVFVRLHSGGSPFRKQSFLLYVQNVTQPELPPKCPSSPMVLTDPSGYIIHNNTGPFARFDHCIWTIDLSGLASPNQVLRIARQRDTAPYFCPRDDAYIRVYQGAYPNHGRLLGDCSSNGGKLCLTTDQFESHSGGYTTSEWLLTVAESARSPSTLNAQHQITVMFDSGLESEGTIGFELYYELTTVDYVYSYPPGLAQSVQCDPVSHFYDEIGINDYGRTIGMMNFETNVDAGTLFSHYYAAATNISCKWYIGNELNDGTLYLVEMLSDQDDVEGQTLKIKDGDGLVLYDSTNPNLLLGFQVPDYQPLAYLVAGNPYLFTRKSNFTVEWSGPAPNYHGMVGRGFQMNLKRFITPAYCKPHEVRNLTTHNSWPNDFFYQFQFEPYQYPYNSQWANLPTAPNTDCGYVFEAPLEEWVVVIDDFCFHRQCGYNPGPMDAHPVRPQTHFGPTPSGYPPVSPEIREIYSTVTFHDGRDASAPILYTANVYSYLDTSYSIDGVWIFSHDAEPFATFASSGRYMFMHYTTTNDIMQQDDGFDLTWHARDPPPYEQCMTGPIEIYLDEGLSSVLQFPPENAVFPYEDIRNLGAFNYKPIPCWWHINAQIGYGVSFYPLNGGRNSVNLRRGDFIKIYEGGMQPENLVFVFDHLSLDIISLYVNTFCSDVYIQFVPGPQAPNSNQFPWNNRGFVMGMNREWLTGPEIVRCNNRTVTTLCPGDHIIAREDDIEKFAQCSVINGDVVFKADIFNSNYDPLNSAGGEGPPPTYYYYHPFSYAYFRERFDVVWPNLLAVVGDFDILNWESDIMSMPNLIDIGGRLMFHLQYDRLDMHSHSGFSSNSIPDRLAQNQFLINITTFEMPSLYRIYTFLGARVGADTPKIDFPNLIACRDVYFGNTQVQSVNLPALKVTYSVIIVENYDLESLNIGGLQWASNIRIRHNPSMKSLSLTNIREVTYGIYVINTAIQALDMPYLFRIPNPIVIYAFLHRSGGSLVVRNEALAAQIEAWRSKPENLMSIEEIAAADARTAARLGVSLATNHVTGDDGTNVDNAGEALTDNAAEAFMSYSHSGPGGDDSVNYYLSFRDPYGGPYDSSYYFASGHQYGACQEWEYSILLRENPNVVSFTAPLFRLAAMPLVMDRDYHLATINFTRLGNALEFIIRYADIVVLNFDSLTWVGKMTLFHMPFAQDLNVPVLKTFDNTQPWKADCGGASDLIYQDETTVYNHGGLFLIHTGVNGVYASEVTTFTQMTLYDNTNLEILDFCGLEAPGHVRSIHNPELSCGALRNLLPYLDYSISGCSPNIVGTFGCESNLYCVVNVSTCGYNTSCIQKTIQRCTGNRNNTVFIPAGTYVCDAEMVIPHKQIHIKGAGIGATIIDCSGKGNRVLTVTNVPRRYDTFIQDITFIGGNHPVQGGVVLVDNSDPIFLRVEMKGGRAPLGGGMHCMNTGTPILRHSTLHGCTGGNGGGISAASGGGVTLDNSDLFDNTAIECGGAISVQDSNSRITIDQSTIMHCGAGQHGGGIHAIGDKRLPNPDIRVNIRRSQMHHNQAAQDGGGLYLRSIWLVIDNSDMHDHQANGDGGLVNAGCACAPQHDANRLPGPGGDCGFLVQVVNSTLNNNNAGNGGLMSLADVLLQIDLASTNADNSALSNGGAVAAVNANLTFANGGKFLRNHANAGAAIFVSNCFLSASHLLLDGNNAQSGGALFVAGGHVDIDASTMQNNVAQDGAAFYALHAWVKMTNSVLFCNNAQYTATYDSPGGKQANAARGGAAFITYQPDGSDVDITGTTFQNNIADIGGAYYLCVSGCPGNGTVTTTYRTRNAADESLMVTRRDLISDNTYINNTARNYGPTSASDPTGFIWVDGPASSVRSGQPLTQSGNLVLKVVDIFGQAVVSGPPNIMVLGTSHNITVLGQTSVLSDTYGMATFDGVTVVGNIPAAVNAEHVFTVDNLFFAGTGQNQPLLLLPCNPDEIQRLSTDGNSFTCYQCPAGTTPGAGATSCEAAQGLVDKGTGVTFSNVGLPLLIVFLLILIAVIIGALLLWRLAQKKVMKKYLIPDDATVRAGGDSLLQQQARAMILARSTSRIGGGLYADIFKAKYNNKWIALKVLRADQSGYEGAQGEFRREAVALSRVTEYHHPAVIELFFFCEFNPMCLGEEFAPNGTVKALLASGKKLPIHERIRIATETAAAMVVVHGSDVVHLDLKTDNLLLDSDMHVKLADFGISRLVAQRNEGPTQLEMASMSSAQFQSQLMSGGSIHPNPAFASTTSMASTTMPMTPVGTQHSQGTGKEDVAFTIQYVDPARLSGNVKDDAGLRRADVYTFGGVMYAVYTQKEPYAGEDARGLLDQLRANPNLRPPPIPNCHVCYENLLNRVWGPAASRPGFMEIFTTLNNCLNDHFGVELDPGYADLSKIRPPTVMSDSSDVTVRTSSNGSNFNSFSNSVPGGGPASPGQEYMSPINVQSMNSSVFRSGQQMATEFETVGPYHGATGSGVAPSPGPASMMGSTADTTHRIAGGSADTTTRVSFSTPSNGAAGQPASAQFATMAPPPPSVNGSQATTAQAPSAMFQTVAPPPPGAPVGINSTAAGMQDDVTMRVPQRM